MSLTQTVVNRPTLVVVIFTVLGLLGGFGYNNLKYELLPDMAPPVISVVTVYPGASPSEVENNVSKRVEDAVSGISNLKYAKSQSIESFSFVMLEFDQSVDIDVTTQDVQRKLNEIRNILPETADEPLVLKFAINELPILRLGVTSTMDSKDFYQFVKNQVQPRLNKVSGTGQIALIGGEEREIRINVDEDKLRSYGLSLLQVVQTIQTGNLDFPTGNVKNSNNELVVRVAGKSPDLNKLRDLRIITPPGYNGVVYVRDVAEVVDGVKDYMNINRINGINSIGMQIQKQSDANAVETAALLKQEMAALEKEYANIQLKFDVAQDSTEFTIEAANSVMVDLLFAVLLVAFVMFVFLHSLRNSLIVMVSIPASIISVFLVMYAVDFSLNLMTLLALSLVVGILVDDSIVVLENIYRHMEMGKHRRQAAVDGRNEIGSTALSITLVDVVVFLPLALVGGMIGNIMREFALVVVFSTMMSLFVSFTITPVLASRLSKLQHLDGNSLSDRFGRWFERNFQRLTNWYGRFLHLCLHRKRWVALSAIGLFVLSFMIAGNYIGNEFIKQADRGQFSLLVELPQGTPLAQTNLVSQDIERDLMNDSRVEKVIAKVGASEDGLDFLQGSSHIVDMTIMLKGIEVRGGLSTLQLSQKLKNSLLLKYPGVELRVRQISIFGTADDDPVQYIVTGPDREKVAQTADKIVKILRETDGAVDARTSSEKGKPELSIDVDKQKMAELGITTADVGTVLQTALTGYDDVKYRAGEDEFDIRVMLDQEDRRNEDNVANLAFVTNTGGVVKLKDFARIERSVGPAKLERYDRIPSVVVQSQVRGKTEGEVDAVVRQKMEEQKVVPEGVQIIPFGNLKSLGESGESMGMAMLAGIVFMYLIMVALYNSYFTPFVVMFSVPLATIGAFMALALAGESMGIFTMLGFIMLIGLVAKNAILLVDFANGARERGLNVIDALVEAGRERIRPIFMTTFAMVIGLMPIALAGGAGAEWKRGLAWALIGGLTSSMFLTLMVVPVVYKILDGWRNFFTRKKRKGSDPQENHQPNAYTQHAEVVAETQVL
ncbi:MAG: efflux RND transporter permease subunit [Bacteroidetes bacterium]|nr:efflux RND transporter permease subunit [Bacteroidota bacterium]